MKNPKQSKQIAEDIVRDVECLLPTALERRRLRESLLGKIEGHLQGYTSENPPTETRRVTILLSDIRGFTALAETYSAMTVMDLLNRYFAVMTDVIVEYGGTIDKLMGDSIMVLFGAPLSEADDVERAIACAIHMQQAMSDFNLQNRAMDLPELYMGIGINTGTVVAGQVGSDHHREYTVIGDEVNLASRIEAQSLRGQILISENTYRLAEPFVLVGEPNRVQVKGKREPVKLYELQGTTRPHSMTVPRREERKSPRVKIHMPCFFQRVEGKQVITDSCQGEVIDISYHGLLMRTAMPLSSYAEICIQMSLQLLGSATSDVYARVISVEKTADNYVCSLEFTAIDLAAQDAVKRFVDSHVYTA